jgi:hypothetical protein
VMASAVRLEAARARTRRDKFSPYMISKWR